MTPLIRPYYVYTPRNIYGEDLVKPYNDLKYEVKSTNADKATVYFTSKIYTEAKEKARQLNNKSEAQWKWEQTPDKPCLGCGYNNLKALKVIGKTQGGKIVLCLNCEAALNKEPIIP